MVNCRPYLGIGLGYICTIAPERNNYLKKMQTTVIALTRQGKILANIISSALEECSLSPEYGSVADRIGKAWKNNGGIICIMATGIVVRSIAPLCRDKRSDPCVVVLDEKGEFVISLLSGHLGGGNDLSRKIAKITGGKAVITTASDVGGHTALDLWIAENNLIPSNPKRLTSTSAKLVNTGLLLVYSDQKIEGLPFDFLQVEKKERADVIISYLYTDNYECLYLITANLFVGFGCNRGTTIAEFEEAFGDMCSMHHIDPRAIAGLASIDLKNDEQGLLEFAKSRQLPLCFYSNDELNSVEGVDSSEAVLKATGAKAVAEPAAVLAAGSDCGPGQIIIRKMKWKNVTTAIAAKRIRFKE